MPNQHNISPEVDAYITAVPAEHRPIFDRLHQLILETLPDARVVISYKMPAYVVAGGRVSLSSGAHGVSLATTVAEPIAEFKSKHRNFKTGKVTVLFPADADLPTDDLRTLVLEATNSGR